MPSHHITGLFRLRLSATVILSIISFLAVRAEDPGAERSLSDTAMFVRSASVVSTGIPAGIGEKNERVIAVNVVTDGNLNPLSLTKIRFSFEGSSDLNDFSEVSCWFSGSDPRLTNGQWFGTCPVQPGPMEISGSQVLNEGQNHFWITADLSPGAAEGDTIKGGILSVTVSDKEYPVIPGTTSDQRLILLEHKLLFSGGDHGSANFRIPAVKTAADGSIVVAVDARIDRSGDLPNDIDILVRRSTDRGDSWSDPVTVADFGEAGASDPSLVCDRNSGDILCMFASHRGLFQSTPSDPIRFQVCRSKDNGQTWSSPQDFTGQIYVPVWYAAWLASGSVHQERGGRIIGAIGVRQGSGSGLSNFMICSDDGGYSWNCLPVVASAVGDEAKIVELNDGRLMMNIRNQTPDYRKVVISEDGGENWGTPYIEYDLPDPFVNGDFIRYTSVLDGSDKSRLLFSIAAHSSLRKNLTVFLSYDEGESWPVSKSINPGFTGYSCLTVLDDGTIGCFYENGEYEEYQLYFTRFSLGWLTGGVE